MKTGIFTLGLLLSLAFVQGTTPNHLDGIGNNFYRAEFQKLNQALRQGWLNTRSYRVLTQDLNRLRRVNQLALRDGFIDRREAYNLNALQRNYNRNYAVAVRNAPNNCGVQRYRNTRPNRGVYRR